MFQHIPIYILISLILCVSLKAQESKRVIDEKSQKKYYSIEKSFYQSKSSRSECDAIFEPTIIISPSSFNENSLQISLTPVSDFSEELTYQWSYLGNDEYSSSPILEINVIDSPSDFLFNNEICLTVSNNQTSCEETYCLTLDYNQISPCLISQAEITTTCSGLACELQFTPSIEDYNYYWTLPDGLSFQGDHIAYSFTNSGFYEIHVNVEHQTSGCKATYVKWMYVNPNFHPGFEVFLLTNDLLQNVQNVMFGDCVDVSNISYQGSPSAIGYFFDENSNFGFQHGLVMTTGIVTDVKGPNKFPNMGIHNGTSGFPLLSTLIPENLTFNASVIKFDFTATTDSIIASRYVFASEEYPEWVNREYNDVFGFFIKKHNEQEYENLALVPGTDMPVSINTINHLLNNEFYIDNSPSSILFSHTEFDGYTEPFELSKELESNEKYNFIIAIADVGDELWDSGVFIEAGSFLGNEPLPISKFNYESDYNTVSFYNQSENSRIFVWDFGDGHTSNFENPVHTYEKSGIYTVKLHTKGECRTGFYKKTFKVQKEFADDFEEVDSGFSLFSGTNSGTFQLYNKSLENAQIQMNIFDLSGRNIISKNNTIAGKSLEQIDISMFQTGIYIIRVIDLNTGKVLNSKVLNP